jgi:hypothetical protein
MLGSFGQRSFFWGSAINSLPLKLGLFALSEAEKNRPHIPACQPALL